MEKFIVNTPSDNTVASEFRLIKEHLDPRNKQQSENETKEKEVKVKVKRDVRKNVTFNIENNIVLGVHDETLHQFNNNGVLGVNYDVSKKNVTPDVVEGESSVSEDQKIQKMFVSFRFSLRKPRNFKNIVFQFSF